MISPGLLALLERHCDPVPGLLDDLEDLADQLEELALTLPDGKKDQDEYGETPAYQAWDLANDMREVTRSLRAHLDAG